MPDPHDLAGRTILQVIPELDGGGAETTVVEITEALRAAGANALIASAGGGLVDKLQALGGEVIPLPVASKNPFTIYANIGRLAALVRARGVDIIHARSRAPAWSCYGASRRTGVPYLATYHGLVHDKPAAKIFYNSVLTRGVKVIANSHFTAQRIADIHRTPAEKIRAIPRGCDVEALDCGQFSDAQKQKQRAAWGFTDSDFVLICPARLTEIKGQHVLLAALGKLQSELRPKLVLVGSAQGREGYVARLKSLIDAHGLDAQVHFAGHLSNMALAYAAANMAVLPSERAEPFGRTIIEASAASLPVIASDEGGFRETVVTGVPSEGATGWLVPPGNSAALAACLDQALNMTPPALTRMGANGCAYATAHFTKRQMCDATLAVYREILAL